MSLIILYEIMRLYNMNYEMTFWKNRIGPIMRRCKNKKKKQLVFTFIYFIIFLQE